jgi:hypothetical protein
MVLEAVSLEIPFVRCLLLQKAENKIESILRLFLPYALIFLRSTRCDSGSTVRVFAPLFSLEFVRKPTCVGKKHAG